MTSKDYEIELRIQQLRGKRKKRRFLLGLLIWCGCVWIVAYLLYGVCVVEGNSMRPAFLPGDIVIYQRGKNITPDYNDVVILETEADKRIIKRIVGKAGDIIEIDERGHLVRNGEEIREPEILFGHQDLDSEIEFPYTVPEGCFFYLGDNRPVSLDSRILGTVTQGDIKGKVIGLFRFGNWNQKTR